MNKKPIYEILKRGFDFFISFIAIFLLLIPFIIVAVLIKIDSKGPVLFIQKRYGKNKELFNIFKFRSMYIETDPNAPTHELNNPHNHITRVGSIIRRTSVDELPQLVNILIGHMSFVGPRPALWNQDDLIQLRDEYFANNIKPGLTGLAQISGRDELDIRLKAKLDGEYVIKRSIAFDLKILFLTFLSVFRQDGVLEGKKDSDNNFEE